MNLAFILWTQALFTLALAPAIAAGAPDGQALKTAVSTVNEGLAQTQEPGCTPDHKDCDTQPATESNSESKMDQLWNAYVQSTNPDRLQSNCRPRRFSPPTGVKTRGTLIMIHGFTACPQQFFAWAEELAKQGYEVLLPILPGHGLLPDPTGKEKDTRELPDSGHWKEYQELGDRMNAIAAVAPGEKVIGGLSVGGAVAMYASSSMPKLYDRQLIVAPLLDISSKSGRFFESLLTHNGHGDFPEGWGQPCKDQTAGGRAGICDFELKHIDAVRKFGHSVQAHALVGNTLTQIVGTESDPAASNEEIKKAYRKYHSQSSRVSVCFMPKGVNHSMISRFDSKREDQWWIDPLLKRLNSYVVDGETIPQADRSADHHGNHWGETFFQCAVGHAPK